MVKKILCMSPILLLLLSTAFPQGRGGGKGGGRAQDQEQIQGQGRGQGQGQVMDSGSRQAKGQPADAQKERTRIKTTQQQRDQIRSCDKLADDVRKQAQAMAKNSEKKMNHGQLVKQQVHMRNQLRKMEQEQERLVKGLDVNQQQAWREQIRDMNRLQQRMQAHQQQMDEDLRGTPEATRVAERAREMERTMHAWRSVYGILSSQAE